MSQLKCLYSFEFFEYETKLAPKAFPNDNKKVDSKNYLQWE